MFHHFDKAYLQCPACPARFSTDDYIKMVARSLGRIIGDVRPVNATSVQTYKICRDFLDLFKPRPIK